MNSDITLTSEEEIKKAKNFHGLKFRLLFNRRNKAHFYEPHFAKIRPLLSRAGIVAQNGVSTVREYMNTRRNVFV